MVASARYRPPHAQPARSATKSLDLILRSEGRKRRSISSSARSAPSTSSCSASAPSSAPASSRPSARRRPAMPTRPGAGPALDPVVRAHRRSRAASRRCATRSSRRWCRSPAARYTYAYATLGELVAWIIGWDLIIEYAVGNVAVAISWGNYFKTLVAGFGIDHPRLAVDRLPDGRADPGPLRERAAPVRRARSSSTSSPSASSRSSRSCSSSAFRESADGQRAVHGDP